MFIVNKDVQFIEEEAWDGSLEKTINVKACIPHEDKEELTSASNSSTITPSTPIQAQINRQQGTPSTKNRTTSRSQESASPSYGISCACYFKKPQEHEISPNQDSCHWRFLGHE